ncbi:ATP-binding protein [Enterocloster clostridioformis]|nr:ATP-binding protein [Lachnoclostridium sp. YL32]NDO28194.1 sensor histidine kinase [Enterocloster clostridioformis]OXE70643.1 ATP-binding protein [Enterocloster clostridioformis]QQR00792.1 sensor histidine kinase [Enterocloster clostridioformis]
MFDIGYNMLDLTLAVSTIWIVKKFLDIFFESKKTNLLSLIPWGIFFSFQIFIEFRHGAASIWMTLLNIILVLIIVKTNYRKKINAKLLIVILLYTVWAIIEMFTFYCMNSLPINYQGANLIGNLISKIVMIIGIYLLSMLYVRHNQEFIPTKYYLALLFIPVGSIYIAVNEFYSVYDNDEFSKVITFCILLIFNIIIFEIYSKLAENFILEKEKLIYTQQIEIVSRSTEEQKKMMENFYEEKHNLINELITLKNSVENSECEMVINDLNRIIKGCDVNENYSSCGNKIVDAIINFKYAIAKEFAIDFDLKIFIPEVLPINQCDIGIVLGNALDNAIEAVKQCQNSKKVIHIIMGIKKEALVLIIKNPYEHIIKKDKTGNLLTSKKNSSRHGFGVNSISRVVENYQGEVLIDTTDSVFSITVIMNLR